MNLFNSHYNIIHFLTQIIITSYEEHLLLTITARALRKSRKRISIEERTLSVYSSRKMHDESDPYEQAHESEDEMYTVR